MLRLVFSLHPRQGAADGKPARGLIQSSLDSGRAHRGSDRKEQAIHKHPTDQGPLHLAWQVTILSFKDFIRDDGPHWAAAIAYYTLLSLFPLLLSIVAIAAYFAEPNWAIQQLTGLVGQFVPRGASQIESVVREAIAARGSIGLLSVVALVWGGSRAFGVLTRALNIAFDVDDTYSFLKRVFIEFATFLTFGLLFILAVASQFVLTQVWQAVGLPQLPAWLINIVIPACLLTLALFLIYAFMPRRRVSRWAALAGAVLATALMLAARPLFLGYVLNFANYNLIYGSLAIVISPHCLDLGAGAVVAARRRDRRSHPGRVDRSSALARGRTAPRSPLTGRFAPHPLAARRARRRPRRLTHKPPGCARPLALPLLLVILT